MNTDETRMVREQKVRKKPASTSQPGSTAVIRVSSVVHPWLCFVLACRLQKTRTPIAERGTLASGDQRERELAAKNCCSVALKVCSHVESVPASFWCPGSEMGADPGLLGCGPAFACRR